MADVREEVLSSSKVRDLIFAYERHSSIVEPNENYEGRPRAKSMGNALSYKLFRQPNLDIHSVVDIEKELVKIEAHLNYYEDYEKETHVAFQEQLFNILTCIVSIDPEGHESTIQKKRDLVAGTQKLAEVLNSKLPSDVNHSYRGVRRTYSSAVRREEAVVSTTSIRSQEHRAILSSSHSTLNGGYKSEESLDSLRHEDSLSVDIKRVEETVGTPTPPQDKVDSASGSSYVPSVSKLKKFFSFRRDDRPEAKVISTAHSSVSRSQSLNLKTNRYTLTKRDKKESGKRKKEIISENDEDAEHPNNQRFLTSSPIQTKYDTKNEVDQMGNVEISLYVEPAKEIHEYRETEREAQHNVSVSKLKSLFEDKRKENNEGLGLLTKKQTEFSSAFNLPYTEANLGAFRLKRTISGNYMNFTGLLRNVDINKKVDLNKSKSMSDLKSENFSHYAMKDTDYEDDLSKEIDDVDDIDRVTITVGKDARELNNNILKTERNNNESYTEIDEDGNIKQDIIHRSSEPTPAATNRSEGSIDQSKYAKRIATIERTGHVHTEEENIASGTVETLKQTFERLSSRTGVDTNEELKHTLHRTIEPISSTLSEEPTLKVPIQLRTGFSTVRHVEEQYAESHNSRSNIEIDEDENNKQNLLHRLTELTPAAINRLEGSIDYSKYAKGIATLENSKHVHTEEENIASGTVETLKQTFEHLSSRTGVDTTLEHLSSRTGVDTNEEIKHTLHRTIEPISSTFSEEPVLKLPIQLRTGFSTISHADEEFVENTEKNEAKVSQDEKEYIAEDEEAKLQIPIELRIGTGYAEVNESHTNEFTVEENITSGTVETLKRTFESLSRSNSQENTNEMKYIIPRTIEPEENLVGSSDEPVLKVPVQLRTGFGNAEIIDEAESVEKSILGRAQIESKTESLMNILESPIAHSTIISGSAYNQGQHVSSTSQVSVSYSQQKMMQHTSSTHVSHRIVSSSESSQSSELSSQKYLRVPSEPNAYSVLTSITPNAAADEEIITITELENDEENEPEKSLKVDLSVSQENIIDELLKTGGSLENIDEEFEKMLQENR